MIKKIITYCFLLYSGLVIPQTQIPLIIDTDGGLDDFRSIVLFLQLSQFKLEAITTSDGTLFPYKTAYRVKSLLECFNKKDIAIGVGKKKLINKPLWRKYSEIIRWGSCYKDTLDDTKYKPASEVITSTLNKYNDKEVIIVCLGSLSNIYETVNADTTLIRKINYIVWYNSYVFKSGTNYIFDPKSADFILNTNIPIYIITNIGNSLTYETSFINNIKQIKTQSAKEIYSQIENIQKLDTTHLKMYDELCALFLANPDIMTFEQNKNFKNIHQIVNYSVNELKELYLNILKEKFLLSKHIIFSKFPLDSSYYQNDINNILNQVILKYGEEEFFLITLTSEIHKHLGIYSIIGVKMGLQAKELLNASNNIKVVSYAGKKEPLSCINDGLMVSTGSTIAHDLFFFDNSTIEPSAKFCFKNKCLKLKLKENIFNKIQSDINYCLKKFNLNSIDYWNEIRKLAIKYWIELNRNEIFEIEYLIN